MLIVFFRLFSADLELDLHRHILLEKSLAIAFFFRVLLTLKEKSIIWNY